MHLTGRALLLALFGAVTFVAAQWSKDPDIDGLWRVVLLTLTAGLVLEAWAQRRVRLTARIMATPPLELGRGAALRLRIGHGARREQRIEWAPVAPDAAPCADTAARAATIAPGVEADETLSVSPRRLGAHVWPVLPARLLGPLGLAWWDRTLDPGATLRIVPDLLRRGAARTPAPVAGARPLPPQETAGEIHRWRSWEPGDPLSRIDWKVTARTGALTTRVFRDDHHLALLLVVDAGCESAVGDGPLDALGQRVNLAARLGESALARGDRVGLVAFSDRVLRASPPVRDIAATPWLRAQFAALVPDPMPADPQVAVRAALRILRQPGGVVLWFGDPPAEPLLALASRHSVVVVMPREQEVEALATADDPKPGRFWTALAAERRLAATRERAALLAARGIAVVNETPARLEAAIWAALPRARRANRRAR